MNTVFQIVPSRRAITIFLVVAGVLFSALYPGSVPAARARQVGSQSLSGWLTILRGDGQDGSTQEIYMLRTDGGQSIPLILEESVTEPVGGVLRLDRKHITVNGDPSGALSLQGGSAPFQVASIAPLAEADAASDAVTGSQKWVSILCKFQGNASEPKNLAYFQDMYMNTYPGLDHFWRELSYNLINTVGSTASGWFTLPHPRSYYISSGSFNLDQAAVDCTGVANPSVNFAGFSGINMMFNDVLDGPNCCAWGGGKYMTLDGVTQVWNMTWEPPWGYGNVAVLGHEMGHAFGLPHSSGNYGATYDNEWDVMSDTWTGCYYRGAVDPVYGCLGQHTISYHKDILGWIPAAQKTSVSAGTQGTLVLEQLALPQTANLKMIKIPLGGSSSHFYTVEARRLTGYDVGLPGHAVIIHDVLTSRIEPAHVIDVDNNGVTGDAGAMWTTGEIFRDNTYKISVAVLAITPSGFRVHVNSGLNIYYITGNIGLSNVTIGYPGGSTTTDATGRYIFPVFKGWSGTVTPVKTGVIFTPLSRSYSNVTADQMAQNFTTTISISGNTEVAGTKLSYSIGTAKTTISQTNGNYSFVIPNNWSGLVTPSHPCFTFSPANRGYANMTASALDQNYAPTFNSGSGCADISTYIGLSKRGRFGVPAGGSTRASFAGISGGSVEVVSENLIPLIAAERVIYKVNGVNTSFSEMMALPASQVDTVYWLPWYNSVELDTQLRFGNTTNATATVHVLIGGQDLPGSPFTIGAYSSARKSFAGVNAGPVKIESDQPIVASERVISTVSGIDVSFSEMMALPNSQLDNTYWLPWYNNKDLNTQLRIANVSGTDASVQVLIGGVPTSDSPFPLAAGASIRKSYPDIDKGPVQIVSDQPIVASERVIYNVNGINTSFSEMMALPNNRLTAEYWLPWYNNKSLNTQLRLANVSGSEATVNVTIGGVPAPGSPFTLAAGASRRLSFPNLDKGPVHVTSNGNVIVSERVIYNVNGINTSFSELMALPGDLLNASNWLPYYNNVAVDTQLRFAAP